MSKFDEHMENVWDHGDSMSFFVHGQHKKFASTSLFMFENSSQFRFNMVWLISSKQFERIIIGCIVFYSILLGMKDYNDVDHSNPVNALIHKIDPLFNTMVYIEFVIKIIAMGFFLGQKAYLTDGWNWLDFFVVITTFLDQVISNSDGSSEEGTGKLKALRAFRLLRPLKLLTAMPSMRLLLSTLFESISSLGGIIGLAMFCYIIFSILGISIWNGKTHYRCYLTEKPVDGEWELLPDYPHLCSDVYYPCPQDSYCGSRLEQFDESGNPYPFNNPNLWVDTSFEEFMYGYTNFDHVGYALLTIFICTTLEGWNVIMNFFQEIYTTSFVHIYFLIVVWICAFFILNLTIALMLMKYDQVDKDNDEDEHDIFETEVMEFGEQIFEEKHKPIIEFIIHCDSIKMEPSAKKYLKKTESFLQQFLTGTTYNVNREAKYYQNNCPQQLLDLIEHNYFDGFIMIVIILNTICLSLDGYPSQSEEVMDILQKLNVVFSIIFTLEVIIKLVALRPKCFFQSKFNTFDFFIVVSSFVQQMMEKEGVKTGGIIMILRSLRVFRIFKLFKQGDMRVLLDSIVFTISTIGPYSIFLSFCIYIFSLVGMSFYAGKIKITDDDVVDLENGESPRANFDNLSSALLTVIQLIIGENWIDIMFSAMRCSGEASCIYFITCYVTGGIILLNLFLAIMLGNFDKAKNYGLKMQLLNGFKELMHEQTERNYSLHESCRILLGEMGDYIIDEIINSKSAKENVLKGLGLENPCQAKGLINNNPDNSPNKAKEAKDLTEKAKTYLDEHPFEIQSDTSEQIRLESKKFFTNASLWIFHIDSRIRRFCLRLSEPKKVIQEVLKDRDFLQNGDQFDDDYLNCSCDYEDQDFDTDPHDKLYKWFDNFILCLIIVSSAMLPLDNPLSDPNSQIQKTLSIVNVILTILFVIEAVTKIIAKGLFFNNLGQIEPYLQNGWNCIDIFVVTVSVADVIMSSSGKDQQLAAIKSLRALRALRPLRVIKRFESLRIVVNCLFSTIAAIQNVLMVSTLLLLIYGIIGVSFFKGQYYSCQDLPEGTTDEVLNQIVTKQDCLDIGGSWKNQNQNFDNILSAMNTLFIMMTTEGWVDVMDEGMDSVGVDLEPKYDNSMSVSIFFISYMIIGSVFIKNLFVGVVIDNFNKNKDQAEIGSAFVTQQQREWIVTQRIGTKVKLISKQPEPHGCSSFFYKIVSDQLFEGFIIVIVILNTLAMSTQHYQMSDQLIEKLHELNVLFSIIFNLEMLIKLLALRSQYFASKWNLLDMFIVLSADIGYLIKYLNFSGNSSTVITVLRAFRILRVVKLLQSLTSVKVIIDAVINILPNIANVMSLFMLAIFVYACIGISLFAKVKEGESINEKNNFRTFGGAMLILMRFSTGEDWQVVMYELSNQENCHSQTFAEIQEEGKLTGCGSAMSIPFFLSFQLLVVMIVLNLTIAAVIDGLSAAQKDNERLFKQEDIDYFVKMWQDYDPYATGKIKLNDLAHFLMELEAPFGELKHLVVPIDPDDEKTVEYKINRVKPNMIKKSDIMKFFARLRLKTIKDRHGKTYLNFADVYTHVINNAFQMRAQSDKQNLFSFKLPTNEKLNNDIQRSWKKNQTRVKNKYDFLEEDDGQNIKNPNVLSDMQQIAKVLAAEIIMQNFIARRRRQKHRRLDAEKQERQVQEKALESKSQNINLTINIYANVQIKGKKKKKR